MWGVFVTEFLEWFILHLQNVMSLLASVYVDLYGYRVSLFAILFAVLVIALVIAVFWKGARA